MPLDWIQADWPAPANIVAGTSTREGGVSGGSYESLNLGAHVGDDSAAVAENRRRFIEECRIPHEPRWLRQVHGDRVLVDEFGAEPREADASVSTSGDDVLVIMSADCLPVVLFSESGSEIAAAHCGWRSLSAGLLHKTVSAMQCEPTNVLAWLGPAISQPAFEVGDEVHGAFVSKSACAADHFEQNARGRWQADLYGIARLQLRDAGVDKVYGGELCTHSDPGRFFSHRRDGECGRMATFIYRKQA